MKQKGSLSKVVQWVQNYLQLNFQKDWSNTSEVMADIRDGIIIQTSFLFSSFSVPSFLDVIWTLWSNETGKGSLSKVVQRVRNYLQLNFQKDWSSTSEVMADIRDGIIIIICTFHPDLLFPDLFPDQFPDLFPRLLHLTDVTGSYN